MMLKFNVLVVGDIVSTVFCLLLTSRRLAAAILMKNQVLACQLGTAALRYISNRGGNNDINETNNQVKSQDSPSAIGIGHCHPETMEAAVPVPFDTEADESDERRPA